MLEHIESFSCLESHCRKNTKQKYLASNLISITKMTNYTGIFLLILKVKMNTE